MHRMNFLFRPGGIRPPRSAVTGPAPTAGAVPGRSSRRRGMCIR